MGGVIHAYGMKYQTNIYVKRNELTAKSIKKFSENRGKQLNNSAYL